MSSKFAMEFGDKYGNDYGEVVDKWSRKLSRIKKHSDKMRAEWGADLKKALGEQVKKAILSAGVDKWGGHGLDLPSDETIQRFADIAVKGALVTDTGDLFDRLHISSTTVLAAASPTELVKRASQTVAQIMDMAFDRFNKSVTSFLTKDGQLTGKRRWKTDGRVDSRHSHLENKTVADEDFFIYKGRKIYGPRPPGGVPADWSNCSCHLQVQKRVGRRLTWVDLL